MMHMMKFSKLNTDNSLEYATHLKSKEELSSIWALNGFKWISPIAYKESRETIKDILRTSVPKESIKKVLDLGTGEGDFPLLLSELYNADITGIDISNTFIDKANKKLSERKHGYKSVAFVEYDTDLYLSGEKSKFDLISAINSLQDMYDPIKTIKSIKGSLRCGGYLFITIPDESAIKSLEPYGRLENSDIRPLRIVLNFKRLDNSSYSWSQYGFRNKWVIKVLKQNGMVLLGTGRLVCDASTLLCLPDMLDISEEKKSELREKTKSLVENQQKSPWIGPIVSYYLARKN